MKVLNNLSQRKRMIAMKHGYTQEGFMFVQIGEITYEKYPTAYTVNIYFEGNEIDVFSHNDIKDDMEKFIESCKEHYEENYNF